MLWKCLQVTLLALWWTEVLAQIPPGGTEYCVMEAMEASCTGNSVMVTRSALYGRMRIGRCVRTDFGFVGCYEDVLGLADGRCSGRRSCTISVPDPMFENTQPCNEEFKSYLEADYTCQEVVNPDVSTCDGATYVRAHGYRGTLASVVTEETGCGGDLTPWVIEAKPGQVVNLTLWDFAAGHPDGQTDAHTCALYAYIKESGSSTRHAVCGGEERWRHIFTAYGTSVLVYISQGRARTDTAAFLIDYAVEGCANPEAPENGWVRREGERAFVGCAETDTEHQLLCRGNEWDANVPLCPTGSGTAWEPAVSGIFSMSTGLAVTVVIGIAMLVSGIIFIIGIIIIRRRQEKMKLRQPYQSSVSTVPNIKSGTLKKSSPAQGIYGRSQGGIQQGDNDYSYVWGREQGDPYGEERSVYETTHHDPRRSVDTERAGGPLPQYFELDPSGSKIGPTYEPVIFSHDYPGQFRGSARACSSPRVPVPVITPSSNSASSASQHDVEDAMDLQGGSGVMQPL